jgi:hypothetical protein
VSYKWWRIEITTVWVTADSFVQSHPSLVIYITIALSFLGCCRSEENSTRASYSTVARIIATGILFLMQFVLEVIKDLTAFSGFSFTAKSACG